MKEKIYMISLNELNLIFREMKLRNIYELLGIILLEHMRMTRWNPLTLFGWGNN